MPQIEVDAKAIGELAAAFEKAKKRLVGQMAERGYQLLRSEVPVVTGNLKQGVNSPVVDYDDLTAEISVSARSAEVGSQEAEVFNAKGQRVRSVTLKGRPAYNYARVVALGTKGRIRPKTASALLIPVPSKPTKGGYLVAGGQIYVMRKSTKGVEANPYHERAARRLEGEAERIADKVLREFI